MAAAMRCRLSVFPALSRSPVRELLDVRLCLGEHECWSVGVVQRLAGEVPVRGHKPSIHESRVQTIIDECAALFP